ncbi:MAG: hypothetical protein CGU29_01055 [Candidatus Dactylopiibacterium carminicum]|uniref:Transglutaminase family protein n=1 Tax=Candidatus Dactylopiibacterium carminicum TaxID=857335 RepID=A0A272EY68_9RHOO|nr:transglutaminase family protein [Candidatus Dactylopiibacterium carminicum]KAF7600447.1 transglutaminase family protein [Candidatus Dactylopiibacterium carminicum]PAS95068.1 MAG: hypothetical protein CGU29_01055 [Candidatus Dactylopiibacterium carminicum]PAT00444.1 MAG: hypothetical protein BSR46_02585 [Candidatus Dactylopiibacterium carminicum]
MKYSIRHETRCHYDSPASYSIRKLRITPREEGGVKISRWEVNTPARSSRSVDAWGNTTHLLSLTAPHENVRIVVTGEVEIPDQGQALIGTDCDGLTLPIYLASTSLTQPDAALSALARTHLGRAPQHIADVLALLEALRAHLRPTPSGGEPLRGAAESFTRQAATLPDQVHVLLTACRAVGLPARFVSGYQLGERVREHAWAGIWLEAAGGWVSFDARRGELASGHQIRLAVGRDYLDACPMRSMHQGGGQEEVRVTVRMM